MQRSRKQHVWKLPHPFIFNTESIVVPGVLTFVVIFLLAPFNFSNFPVYSRLIHALISASIVSSSIWWVVLGMRYIFPVWTKQEAWTVGKEIVLFVLVVTVIAVSHFGLFLFQDSKETPTLLFQQAVLRTVAISIFPIIGLVLFEQYNHRTKQLKRALVLNKAIRAFHFQKENETNATKPEQDLVWFLGANGKPVCQLDTKKIQFIKAEGNYIEVYYLNELSISKKQLIRNKLSEVEKSVSRPHFCRVHRSYIANLNQVETVSGNARDLGLAMKESAERIPVSRAMASKLLKEISSLSHSSQTPPNRPK